MPPIYDLTVYKLKTRKALKRTARSRAKPDRPLPVSAVVTGIEVPIRTQALQATVKLSDGAVQAQVSGPRPFAWCKTRGPNALIRG